MPSSRTAALMRAIHSARNWRFFWRRSRKPLVCLKTFLWRARAVTLRLTLGMARSSARVRQHRADRRRIGLIDAAAPAHLALALRGFLREDVALVGARALDAAAAAHAEALRGAALGLHLRHTKAPCFCFSLT